MQEDNQLTDEYDREFIALITGKINSLFFYTILL